MNCHQVKVEHKIRDLNAQLTKLKLESQQIVILADDSYKEEFEEVVVNACIVAFTLKEDA